MAISSNCAVSDELHVVAVARRHGAAVGLHLHVVVELIERLERTPHTVERGERVLPVVQRVRAEGLVEPGDALPEFCARAAGELRVVAMSGTPSRSTVGPVLVGRNRISAMWRSSAAR
jgi:hypothetical protein